MKKEVAKFWVVLLLACLAGLLLAKIDTSKNWDDTAITAGLVLICSFVFGAIMPNMAWLWALIIGGFIVAFNVMLSNNYGSVLALVIAFTGAYAAVLSRRLFSKSY